MTPLAPPTSLTFFHPSREAVGGAEFLCARMADFLARALKQTVYVVEYPDGFARDRLADSPVTLLDYQPGVPTVLPENTCFITPFSHMIKFHPAVTAPPDTRLLFWTLHFYSALWELPYNHHYAHLHPKNIRRIARTLYRQDYFAMQRLMRTAHAAGGLAFMDSFNAVFHNRFFNLNLPLEDILYLPVPISDTPDRAPQTLVRPGEIHVGWLGRLEHDKIHTLLGFLLEADREAQRRRTPIHVHIIGEGQEAAHLAALDLSDWTRLVRAGVLRDAALTGYMSQHLDILFAIGTACLEGARLSLPVVPLRIFHERHEPHQLFVWLFETQGYNLGQDARVLPHPGNKSLTDILDAVYARQQKAALGERCREYMVCHHQIDGVGQRLLQAARNNRFTLEGYRASGIQDLSQHKRAYDFWIDINQSVHQQHLLIQQHRGEIEHLHQELSDAKTTISFLSRQVTEKDMQLSGLQLQLEQVLPPVSL